MTDTKPESALAPFKSTAFAVLWTATVAGNVGSWMRDTTSAWMMATISPSPLMVSLIQAASTLPIFLLALPAGTFADVFDKRRLMIAIQLFLACISISLAVAAHNNALSAELLLALTVLGGVGTALATPVWQAIVPQLVPKPDLKAAIALNGIGVNISRAIGPAVAGLIIAGSGAALAYTVDVASYVIVLGGLVWWRSAKQNDAYKETVSGAMVAGLRYAIFNPDLHRVLLKAVLFFIPASAFWSLLPLVARIQLSGGPSTFGLLMTAAGAGAIAGAFLMPILRKRLNADVFICVVSVAVAVGTFGLSQAADIYIAAASLVLCGAAWIGALSALNAAAQLVLPNWVRGRGLAIYLTAFYGAMTLGSVIWGQVGNSTSLQVALMAAASTSVVLALTALFVRLPNTDVDLTPSDHWPAPVLADDTPTNAGPVMVLVDYVIPTHNHAAFDTLIRHLAKVRRRDGAYSWGLQVDEHDRTKITEWFLVASWDEHMRQHRRVSGEDKKLQDQIHALQVGSEKPHVRHLLTFKS